MPNAEDRKRDAVTAWGNLYNIVGFVHANIPHSRLDMLKPDRSPRIDALIVLANDLEALADRIRGEVARRRGV